MTALESRDRSLPVRLDRHREALRRCRRCVGDAVLCAPVVAEARAPRVMLVGQAPGATETVDRRPFTGRSGRTLFGWLARAGIAEADARRDIYISAMTRCYPGPHPGGRGDRVPSPAERARCADWLAAELEIIRPALVIPVGRLAADRFLGPRPLDALVGRRHVVAESFGETVVVPLPHPSGASAWVHERGHRELVDQAIELLAAELARVGVASPSRSAA